MEIANNITSMAAFMGIILSITSIFYTYHQNRRRLTVNLTLNLSKFHRTKDLNDIFLDMSAFNSGYRSVAIISYEIYINDKLTDFNLDYLYNASNKILLPHVLNEGDIAVTRIEYFDLHWIIDELLLKKEDLVKITGYFQTAENKMYWVKPIEITKQVLDQITSSEYVVKI